MKAAQTKHYAKALAGLTEDVVVFEQLISDLKSVQEQLETSVDLMQYLVDPHLPLLKKKEALKIVFQDFISERTYNVLYLLIKDKKLLSLPEIIVQARKERLYNDNVAEVVIESVIPVTSKQEQAITKIIADKIQKNVVVRNTINKDLIGGLRLTIDDVVLDGSLLGRINRLKQKIAAL